jgi:hypothetical protein
VQVQQFLESFGQVKWGVGHMVDDDGKVGELFREAGIVYGLGFALKPRAQIRVRGEMTRQYLDGYYTIEASIFNAVHPAHTAGADRRENLVSPEVRTNGEGHKALNDSISHSVKQKRT